MTNGDDHPPPAMFLLRPILNDPLYEGFAFERRDADRLSLAVDFMPKDIPERGRKWTAPRLRPQWAPPKVIGRVRRFNDYPCVNLRVPAFSRRAVDALRDDLEPNGEILPLLSPVGEYFAFNTTTVADVLDESRSTIEWMNKARGVAVDIRRYVLRPDGLAGLAIFQIPQDPGGAYVTEPFVERARRHGLKGMRFIQVSPRDRPFRLSPMLEFEDDEPPANASQSVVALLGAFGEVPDESDVQAVHRLCDDLDDALYDPSQEPGGTDYLGRVESFEHEDDAFRIFFSCPDADALAGFLRPRLERTDWPGEMGLLKRYSPFQAVGCREFMIVVR